MIPSDQSHEDRAALEAAMWKPSPEGIGGMYGMDCPKAFGAGWQARGAYDQERLERLRVVMQAAVDNELHEGRCPTFWGTREGCTCWLRDARAALASVPGATGESAEDA